MPGYPVGRGSPPLRAPNRSKGDQDLARWKPPLRSFWCTYAKDYVTVKAAYQLTIDQAEHDALAEMSGTC